MKICSSEVNMLAQHQSLETKERSESLTIWKDGANSLTITFQEEAATLALSEEAKSLLASAPLPASQKETEGLELTDEDKLKIKLIENFVKALTGKNIKIKIPNIKLKDYQSAKNEVQMLSTPTRQGWGLIYEAHEEVYEKETMSFSANGLVKTADGREITLNLQLSMSREFYARTDFSLRMGDAAKIDPLVINYSGDAPSLTTAKYAFDLDNDGTEEQLSFLQDGSGFLALDKNNDGFINNGNELFGLQSGDGFEDLALYDQDANNWLDENDPIFSQLRIWSKDATGHDQLVALGQVGIGAIYLGHVQSLFDLKNGTELLGQIRETGLFLREDGGTGTVQHLDLAV